MNELPIAPGFNYNLESDFFESTRGFENLGIPIYTNAHRRLEDIP